MLCLVQVYLKTLYQFIKLNTVDWEYRYELKRSWSILMYFSKICLDAGSSQETEEKRWKTWVNPTKIRTKYLPINYYGTGNRFISRCERETDIFITGNIHDSMGYMYRDSWLIISTRPSSERGLKGPRPQQHNRKGIQLHRPAPPSWGEWDRAFRIFTVLGRIFLQEILVLLEGCNSRGFRSWPEEQSKRLNFTEHVCNESSVRTSGIVEYSCRAEINMSTKTKLHGLSPPANYTDRGTAACRRNDCQLFADRGCYVVSVTDP
jgi:hypothetical protein